MANLGWQVATLVAITLFLWLLLSQSLGPNEIAIAQAQTRAAQGHAAALETQVSFMATLAPPRATYASCIPGSTC